MDDKPTPTRDPLPADFLCPACGYDLSAARVERCSECGLEIDDEIIAADGRRKRFIGSRPWRELLKGLWPILGLSIMCAAFLYDNYYRWGTGTASLAGVVAGVIVSLPLFVATSIFCSRMRPGYHRAAFCALLWPNSIALIPFFSLMAYIAVVKLTHLEDGYLKSAIALVAIVFGIFLSRSLWPRCRDRAIERAGLYLSLRRHRQLRVVFCVSLIPSIIGVLFLIFASIDSVVMRGLSH